MIVTLKKLLVVFSIPFWVSIYAIAQAATYYVSPNGNNSNPGTIAQPFATIQQAHDVASAGDTIYLRGGTYALTTFINITRSGNSGNRINLWAYPGEIPVIDGANIPSGQGNPNFNMVNVSWWYFKGLEIKNSQAVAVDLRGSSSNNIFEQLNLHHNVITQSSGSAIAVSTNTSGGNNQIINCDAHHNGNYSLYNGGSGIGVNSQATGNVIRGNRLWRNNDNGIELWDAANVLVENNWVWETGYNDSLQRTAGDGVGFKLGGGGSGDGNSTVRNNLAWRNAGNGFDENSADNPLFIYNNTAWANGAIGGGQGFNYEFSMSVAHQLKNNISYLSSGAATSGSTIQVTNSWNTITVTTATFLTLDFTANMGSRKADGSLPDSNFLKLNPSAPSANNAVDKGTNIGLSFNGGAPDLGAYENANSVTSLAAPSNLLVQP
jgi:hypothetical protein